MPEGISFRQKVDNFLTDYLRNTTSDQEILDFYGEGNIIGRKGINTNTVVDDAFNANKLPAPITKAIGKAYIAGSNPHFSNTISVKALALNTLLPPIIAPPSHNPFSAIFLGIYTPAMVIPPASPLAAINILIDTPVATCCIIHP